MLISHTLKYLPAQLLSPAAQLVSMILWTHWLVPSEMGLFTLVSVTQEIAFTVCLGWFSVYALRYLPPDSDVVARQRYLGAENAVVAVSLIGAMAIAVFTAWSLHDGRSLWLSSLVIGLFFATRAVNTHYGERARAQSAFLAYSLLQVAGPLGGLGLGWLAFQYVEASALVLLASYAAAQALGTLLALPMLGMHWRFARPDSQLLRAALSFGGPVLGLGVLGWVAENYIRYLVQWQSGAAALGLMIVGWSLGRRCAAVASMLVATAAFPLAARLLNEGRRDEAVAQLRVNAVLMLAVLVPVTAALQLLGPALVSLAVAAEYRQTTIELLGLSVLAGTLRNLHMHVTDQFMVLERRLKMVAIIDVVEIVACVLASLFGLFFYGLHGAVIGQALGSFLTLGLSMYWAHTRQGFRWPWLETGKVLLATVVMAVVIAWWGVQVSLVGLLMGTAVGMFAYALASTVLFAPQLLQLRASRQT
ncbi:MAG: lipopolysaccharide biosynthesis protein [Rhodoferax sp.]|uniref:lipopolysaccharide biosynthesis protein n=1 Tax=Rhodoferax sp. TaxID=50421 RepID=UPI0026231899|nr:lipopolysaccharide biosynthesis protein [Rhodoferax sp.]MDD2880612.1 lipopolysaccharide biosynthesis protein [Rhodoferax sp.]